MTGQLCDHPRASAGDRPGEGVSPAECTASHVRGLVDVVLRARLGRRGSRALPAPMTHGWPPDATDGQPFDRLTRSRSMQGKHGATPEEEWRPISGRPGYFISSHGRVASTRRYRRSNWRLLAQQIDRDGYPKVTICGSTPQWQTHVHRLVARAFLGEPSEDKPEVRHLDGDPTNNHLSNLAYGSRSENARDCLTHGTHTNARKVMCKRGHPFDEANTRVNELGRRRCRACERWRRHRGNIEVAA